MSAFVPQGDLLATDDTERPKEQESTIENEAWHAVDELIGRWPSNCAGEILDLLRAEKPEMAPRMARELWERQELHGRLFGELFPGMHSIRDPEPPARVAVRARNVLLRFGVHTWADLAEITPLQLRTAPNLGLKSFVEIAEEILVAWATDRPSDPSLGDPFDSELERMFASLDGARPEESGWRALREDSERALRALWRDAGASTLGEALRISTETDAPAEVTDAIESVLGSSIIELLGLRPADETAWTALFDVPEPQRLILRRRIFTEKPRATLTELGRDLGVTRERVRQLEIKARESFDSRLRGRECEGILHLAADLGRRLGHVADRPTMTRLVRDAVISSGDPPSDDIGLREGVLMTLCGPYTSEGELLWSPAGQRRLAEAKRALSGVPLGDEVDGKVFEELVSDIDASDNLHPAILEQLSLRRDGERLVLWRGSLRDKAVATLRLRGRPLSMLEIHEELGFDRNPRSLAVQVQGDARIMRRGKDLYGLREWGGEEYSGVLEELEQAIERAGGSVDLSELVDRFVAEFGVSPSSVRAYAADRRFVRNADGSLSLRTSEHSEVSYSGVPIEETPGAFLIGSVWHARFEVDHDLLRGSGTSLRRGIALEAGLEPDLTIGVEYEEGTVTFSWSRTQPTIGSLRPVASAHSCTEGDLLFLPLTGAEPRPSRVVRAMHRSGRSGPTRLAYEMGLSDTGVDHDDPSVVARALGLPAGADWHDVVDRLRDRGEGDLLAHLPARWL